MAAATAAALVTLKVDNLGTCGRTLRMVSNLCSVKKKKKKERRCPSQMIQYKGQTKIRRKPVKGQQTSGLHGREPTAFLMQQPLQQDLKARHAWRSAIAKISRALKQDEVQKPAKSR
eukprot:1547295-Amphidinium_carterae.1